MTREEAKALAVGDRLFKGGISENSAGQPVVRIERFMVTGVGRTFVTLKPVYVRKGEEVLGSPSRHQPGTLTFYSRTEVAAGLRLAKALEELRESHYRQAKEADAGLALARSWLLLYAARVQS